MLLGSCNVNRIGRIGMIGALPVGLKGKIYGQPFKVLIQYDAFGGVKAQIYEDEQGGGMITEVTGRKGEIAGKTEALTDWAINRAISEGRVTSGGQAKIKKRNTRWSGQSKQKDYTETTTDVQKVKADIKKRCKLFITDLHQEVVAFNKGKDTKTVKSGVVNIAPKKTARKTPAKNKTKTINVRSYNVPAYTVPAHKRKIKVR